MDPSENVVTCALCRAPHTNTTVCDECADLVAADLDAETDGDSADRLRDVLRAAGCGCNVSRIDEVRAARAILSAPDVAQVPWARDFETTEGVTT
jgi:hypothetical protein